MLKLLREFLVFVIGLVEALLGVRFVLKLLAANPAADFVNWIYETTNPLLEPFLLAFPKPALKGGFILEFTTLFAVFAYLFGGYIVLQILEVIDRKVK